MQISKSIIAALCCVLLFLAVPCRAEVLAATPAGSAVTCAAESAGGSPSQSADPDTFDPFNMLEESDQQESGQFGAMPDMKRMRIAVEIIGDTPLDQLSAEQLSRLEEIGVDQDTLQENADLISEMIAALSDPDAAGTDSGEGRDFSAPVVIAFGALIAAAVIAAVHCGKRRS